MGRRKGSYTSQHRRSMFLAVTAVLLCLMGSMLVGEDRLQSLQGWLEQLMSDGAFVMAPESASGAQSETQGALSVHYIDVGQGDCILIRAGEQSVLVDAGERGNSETIVNYLNKQGVETLDLVIATHPHSDHIGSMPEVLEQFGAGELLCASLPEELIPTTRIYEKLLDTAEEKNIPMKDALPGMEFALENGAKITVLGPDAGKAEDLNNTSIVFRLDFGETSFLFTGDAEKASEEEILAGAYREKLEANVLKLGHHGSSTSTSEKWLEKVSPQYAVALLGKDNEYGHPHEEILTRLEEKGVTLYRSDLNGNIVFTSDGKTVTPPSAA